MKAEHSPSICGNFNEKSSDADIKNSDFLSQEVKEKEIPFWLALRVGKTEIAPTQPLFALRYGELSPGLDLPKVTLPLEAPVS